MLTVFSRQWPRAAAFRPRASVSRFCLGDVAEKAARKLGWLDWAETASEGTHLEAVGPDRILDSSLVEFSARSIKIKLIRGSFGQTKHGGWSNAQIQSDIRRQSLASGAPGRWFCSIADCHWTEARVRDGYTPGTAGFLVCAFGPVWAAACSFTRAATKVRVDGLNAPIPTVPACAGTN